MCRSSLRVLTFAALVAAADACTTPNPNYLGDGPASSTAGIPDAGAADYRSQSEAATLPDTTPPLEEELFQPSQAGLGRICSGQARCEKGQFCLYPEPHATRGICTRYCNDYNDPCPSAGPSFDIACADYEDPRIGIRLLCLVFCASPDGPATPCPNSADYKCVVLDPQALGICLPK